MLFIQLEPLIEAAIFNFDLIGLCSASWVHMSLGENSDFMTVKPTMDPLVKVLEVQTLCFVQENSIKISVLFSICCSPPNITSQPIRDYIITDKGCHTCSCLYVFDPVTQQYR